MLLRRLVRPLPLGDGQYLQVDMRSSQGRVLPAMLLQARDPRRIVGSDGLQLRHVPGPEPVQCRAGQGLMINSPLTCGRAAADGRASRSSGRTLRRLPRLAPCSAYQQSHVQAASETGLVYLHVPELLQPTCGGAGAGEQLSCCGKSERRRPARARRRLSAPPYRPRRRLSSQQARNAVGVRAPLVDRHGPDASKLRHASH